MDKDRKLNEEVDEVIKSFDNSLTLSESLLKANKSGFELRETEELINRLLLFGIIQEYKVDRGFRIWTLSVFGHEVKRHGSWTNYLVDKAEEQKANRKLVAISITTNKLQIPLLCATAIFTLLTLCITCADFLAHDEEESIQLEMLRLQEEANKFLEQGTKTVLPCSDSSANSVSDSLQ
jgi:hypothetical protein